MSAKLISLVVLVALISLVGGALAVNCMMGTGNHVNCLAGIPGNIGCEQATSLISFVSSHIRAFTGALTGIAVAIVFLILAYGAAQPLPDRTTAPHRSFAFAFPFDWTVPGTHKQQRWFSILEKRDPAPVFAMNR